MRLTLHSSPIVSSIPAKTSTQSQVFNQQLFASWFKLWQILEERDTWQVCLTTRIKPFISAGKVFRANYNFNSRRPDLFTTKVKYSSTSHFYHTGSDHKKLFGNNTYNESASNRRSANTIHSSQYHMCRSLVSIYLLAIERTIYTVLSQYYTCRRFDLTITQSYAYDIYSFIAISAKGLTHINSLLLQMRITFTPSS